MNNIKHWTWSFAEQAQYTEIKVFLICEEWALNSAASAELRPKIIFTHTIEYGVFSHTGKAYKSHSDAYIEA